MTDLNPDERLVLTRRTMDLLEGWDLGAKDILRILSLPDSIKARVLSRFREDEPFPDDPEVNRRVAYLMRIEEALHTYFPRNPEMRSLWVKRRRARTRLCPLPPRLHLRLGSDRLQERVQST
jgi:hypothetical protein